MKNLDIAKIFSEIAIYLEMQEENIFKIRAYENASQSLASLSEDVEDLYKKGGIEALQEIPYIGKGLAEKIEEYIKTGKIKYYEELKSKIPVDLSSLSGIEGLGPKKIKILYKKLGIKNAKDLEKAVLSKKIRSLKGFGEKSEQNILKALEFKKKSSGRMAIFEVENIVKEIESYLKSLPSVKRVVIAGSFRRRKETVGDIDILVISDKPEIVMESFTKMKNVVAIYGKGQKKSTVHLNIGIDADLRVVDEKSFGAALNYFTGSKEHNIELRKIAIEKGWKLSEYGLFKGDKQIAGSSEEELYKKLGLMYIEPELRENSGEIEAAKKKKLPDLIKYTDLKGDMQVQTSWSDGSSSIYEMALAAIKFGLEYIVITDHTKSLAMTGLDEKMLKKQGAEIEKINKKINSNSENFRILKGAEVNILKDGSLDIENYALKELDVVGAAVHSNFHMNEKEMTKRIVKAMENPHVDIIFHPTGRIIKKREPYNIDINELLDAAKRTNTVLEIDSLERLDLKDEHIRAAVKKGVLLAIDSDAHSPSHYSFLKFGIDQARRGWAEKKDIINAWELEKMLKMLK